MALDKQAFYSQYAQVAIEQQKRYGIPASITLAQMGLESGFGTSTPARRSNNFFGVKVGSSWTGAYDYYSDDRPNEKFRRYNNVMESIEDHSKVLMKSRYSHCQTIRPPIMFLGQTASRLAATPQIQLCFQAYIRD